MARFLKKLLSNKTDDDGDSYTSAHLGEENNFYYNEELKQWVMKGEEEKVREELNSAPPPMPGKDLAAGGEAPPPMPMDANGSCGLDSNSHRSSAGPTHPGGRRITKSSQLYTNIPGMTVTEEKPMLESFLNLPTPSLSHFVPSKEVDPSALDYAYGDFLKPRSSTNTEPEPSPETEKNQE